MRFTASLSIGHKLLLCCAVMIFLAVAGMAAGSVWRSSGLLGQIGLGSLQAIVGGEMETINLQHQVLLEKLRIDLGHLEELTRGRHSLALEDGAGNKAWTVTDQATGISESLDIPVMTQGGDPLDGENFTVVDLLKKHTGSEGTIFQALPGRLVRVSTTLADAGGKPAVGTFIPEASPVYQAVMRGETYTGRAQVLNDWFLGSYKPVRDVNTGQLLAVLFVGRPILSPELERTLSSLRYVDKGHAFVFNSSGRFIHHPDSALRAAGLAESGLGRLLRAKDGEFVRYAQGGVDRLAYVRVFEPWDWHVVITIAESDLTFGLERTLVITALLIGLALMAAGLLAAWALSRSLTRPLRDLAGVAARVSAGELGLRAQGKATDEVGRLAVAFNALLDTLSDNLAVNEAVLNTIPDPLFLVDGDYRIITANEATLRMAGKGIREVKGLRCADIFQTPVCDSPMCPVERLRQGEPLGDELINCRFRGREASLKAFAAPVQDSSGRQLGFVELLEDVTQAVAKEQEAAAAVERIRAVNEQVMAVARQVAAETGEISGQVSEVKRSASDQKDRMAEAAAAVEQMNATIGAVARNAGDAAQKASESKRMAEDGAQVVRRSLESIGESRRLASGLKDSVTELERDVQGITTIIRVISDIADQTNMLALNAAIEAARAGNAGRGFAVVADEVRKLAEKTVAATREVGKSVAAILASTASNARQVDQAVDAVRSAAALSEESGKALGAIVAVSDIAADQIRSIAAASGEQSDASGEIRRLVEAASSISARTAAGMDHSERALAQLGLLARRLNAITGG